MKPPLFELFLEFDKQVDYFQYEEEYLVNRGFSLGEPITCIRVQRYEDTLLLETLNWSPAVKVMLSTVE
jgi:hypothetical protein